MSVFTASARHEVLALRRSRTAYILVVIFLAMVLASAVIGWLTTRTVTDVYQQILAEGLTRAANPFVGVSPLYFARNTVIYVVLIGCLMAIVLGVESTLRDRQQRTADLVLTRPVSVPERLLGQFAGIGLVILAALVLSLSLSWIVISIITGGPLSVADTGRIVLLGVASWGLMVFFAGIGMVSGVLARHETAALLAPILLWSGITFVLPQLGTAARPIALLNPVPSVAVSGQGFDVMAAITTPLSITELYKTLGGHLLNDPLTTGSPALAVTVLVIACGAVIAAVASTPRARLRRSLDD